MLSFHPSKDVADIKGLYADEKLASNHVFEWLTKGQESPFLHDFCFSVSSRRETKCGCLLPLMNTYGKDNSRTLKEVSLYVVRFSRMSRGDRIREIMGWKRYADIVEKACKTKVCYCLPLSSIGSDDSLPNPDNGMMICANAMLAILGKGRGFWTTCCNATKRNEVPSHGLKGKQSNNAIDPDSDLHLSLLHFFEEMEELAEPRATRLVREATNNGLRDDNGTMDLPAWTTKRNLYRRWCYDQGWVLRSTDMGNWKRTPREDYEGTVLSFVGLVFLFVLYRQLTYSISISEGGEPSVDDLVSWSSFLAFWSNNYRHLIIRRPNHDICPDCYIAANVLKFGARENADPMLAELLDLEEHEDDCNNEEDDDDAFPERMLFSLEERENEILKASKHVILAKRMRELFNSYVTRARLDTSTNVAHALRTYMRIGDYCQKMEMPYFGAEQPGDTYYMSPVSVNCFGLVDPSGTFSVDEENVKEYRHLLKAYVYDESVAGCGGNHVASLLIKDLRDSGLMDRSKGPGKHFVAAFDNCPGQNKNNHVLKTLCAWLVEQKYFLKVTVLFLVKGHTKNPVDHLFNALKREYRMQNIETFDDLIPILNKSDDVIAEAATTDDFHDWNGMLKELYSDFPFVLKYHLFESESIEKISCQMGPDSPSAVVNLKFPKRESDENRAQRLQTLAPTRLNPPGLKEIKQVELYTKFRKFIKPINWDKTCPYPGAEVMERIRKTKNAKSAVKRKLKTEIANRTNQPTAKRI